MRNYYVEASFQNGTTYGLYMFEINVNTAPEGLNIGNNQTFKKHANLIYMLHKIKNKKQA